ncbi:hypothetical protein ABW19_dt0206769 [Dactylella cylindrospora]|nr:hypothetical protein ABW19_dt0206769 [Dactylella cylindrospora]
MSSPRRTNRSLRFIVEIRAHIVTELPRSFMEPDLSGFINTIVTLFSLIPEITDLHFIVKSEIVSTALRRVFLRNQFIELALSKAQYLKFSAGSEWIIRLCGSESGLHALENSPGLSGNDFVPYSINFTPIVDGPQSFFSGIGDYRAANILKGISLLPNNMLTNVCIYGRFTQEGLLVFIEQIPHVTHLTIIGEVISCEKALVLGLLPCLVTLNMDDEIDNSRVLFENYEFPVDSGYLWSFAGYIPSLQQLWYASRFVGTIVRDDIGQVVTTETCWRDSWEVPYTVDVEMNGF